MINFDDLIKYENEKNLDFKKVHKDNISVAF